MNLSSKDLVALRIPGLVLLVAIVAAVVLEQYTAGLQARAEKKNKDQLASLQQARERLQRSDGERNMILQYLPGYRQLQKIGFAGDEQRLNWVENLRTANLQVGLFGVQYEITAQAPYPQSFQDSPIAHRLQRSRMNISFGVVHEEDVMRFLKALSDRQSGLYALTGCSLDRGGLSDAPEARRANLMAQCSLSWLTVSPERLTQ